VGCQLRGDRILDLLKRVVGVRANHGEENLCGTVQQSTRSLHRDDRVVERRRGHLLGDHIDLGKVLPHALLEGRLVVLVPEEIEPWSVVRESALDKERIRSGGRGWRRRALRRRRRAGPNEQNRGRHSRRTSEGDPVV
jgi:hypothetical protein